MSTPNRRLGEIRDIDGNLIPGTTIIRESKPRTENPEQGSLNPPQADVQSVQQPPSTYPNYSEGRSQKGRGGTYSTVESLMHKVVFHCIDAEGTPVSNVSLKSDASMSTVDGASDLNGNISFYLPPGESHLNLGGRGIIKTASMYVPKEIAFTPRAFAINIERESNFTYFCDSGVLLEGEMNPGTKGNPGNWLSRNFPIVAATGVSALVLYLATKRSKEEPSPETQTQDA